MGHRMISNVRLLHRAPNPQRRRVVFDDTQAADLAESAAVILALYVLHGKPEHQRLAQSLRRMESAVYLAPDADVVA